MALSSASRSMLCVRAVSYTHLWTRDLNRAIRVSRGIETGRMWVNTYNQIPEGSPFGGYKESGIGLSLIHILMAALPLVIL